MKGLVLPAVEDLTPHAHPKTGDADKFFLGDRFHEANVRYSNRYKHTHVCKDKHKDAFNRGCTLSKDKD